MSVEGSTGICRLLQTLGTTRRGDPLSRSFFRLHHRNSLLEGRFIGSSSLNRRSSGIILLWVLVVTLKGIKGKRLCISQEKEKEASKRENFQSAKTHESKRSKSSSSSLGAEGSPTAALEAEVLEEMGSSTHFLFLSRLRSSE
jgi:hypothetical protein